MVPLDKTTVKVGWNVRDGSSAGVSERLGDFCALPSEKGLFIERISHFRLDVSQRLDVRFRVPEVGDGE